MKFKAAFFSLFLLGCASWERDCNSGVSQSFGADWVVVQYKMDGEPINCWNLTNAAISNEQGTDGIYWQDPSTGNLVHISGWYNRVQVVKNNHEAAAIVLGVELSRCKNGKYAAAKVETKKE